MNAASHHVVFSHGQESGPWGSKITAMAEVARNCGLSVDSVDYQGIKDPTERCEKLVALYRDTEQQLILVGSSMGAHVAASAAIPLRPAALFLLAPAFYMPGFEAITPPPAACPTVIVHGWKDDIVPAENSIRFAEAAHCDLHLIDSDHRLTDALDTINLLFTHFLKQVSS